MQTYSTNKVKCLQQEKDIITLSQDKTTVYKIKGDIMYILLPLSRCVALKIDVYDILMLLGNNCGVIIYKAAKE